jgi:cobaltochelatase CobS
MASSIFTHKHARGILRSRIRRHPDAAARLNGVGVDTLKTPDLAQLAALLSLDIPTAREGDMLDAAKAQGFKGKAALVHADFAAQAAGLGGAGLADVLRGTSAPAGGWQPDPEADADADDTADEDDGPDADATPDATPAPEADPVETAARELAASVRRRFAEGDFPGFDAALLDMARAASRPAPVAAPAGFFDPSKIDGHVPAVLKAGATLKARGVDVPATADLSRAVLDVYDAPDAPAVDPAYIWPEATALIVAMLARGRHVFLNGPKGTGKTEFAAQLAARFGRPFARISADDQTEAAVLTGMTAPDASGGTVWKDGQLTKAIRRPGTVILLDEPSVARPGALMVMQAILDGSRALYIAETGERVPLAPGVVILAADNTNGTGDTSGQYEGTRRLNAAFLDRFALFPVFDYLDPDQEARILTARTGCKARTAAALCKWAALTRRAADAGDLSHGVGLRRLMALAEAITDGAEPARAFALSVLQAAPHDDVEPLRQMWAAEVRPEALA